MKPMLAHVYRPDLWPRDNKVFVQPKLNGVRALYQNGNFQSRDEIPWEPNKLKHIADVLKEVFGPNIILDGELYVHGWLLQRINQAVAVNSPKISEDTLKVQYHIFDRVGYTSSFWDRFEIVWAEHKNLLGTSVIVVQTSLAFDPVFADEYYARCISKGYEGIMYRLGDCPYTTPKQLDYHKTTRRSYLSDKNNRTWHLLKRKGWLDGEFECVAIVEGEGKRSGMVGAFLCKTGSLVMDPTFKVGSGLDEVDAKRYFENPTEAVGHLIKVKYLCLTREGKPFNPTVMAVL